MTDKQNFSLNNLEPFNRFSQSEFENFISETSIISFSMGDPLSLNTIISDSIYLILQGQARLVRLDENNPKSIFKLGAGQFINLASQLRGCSCELVIASTDLKALKISDFQLLDLYTKNQIFKDWCNSTIFPAEAYELANSLTSISIRQDINITSASQAILKHGKLKSYTYADVIQKNENLNFIASNNINEEKILTQVENNITINSKSIFSSRVIEIPQSLYQEFNKNELKTEILQVNSTEDSKQKLEENQSFSLDQLRKSDLSVEHFNTSKNIKLIKGEGLLKETSACIQMICQIMDLPFRRDTVEKIISNEISSGKSLTIESIGGILSMFGLHISRSSIPFKYIDRVLTPCLIDWNKSFAIIEKSTSGQLSIVSPVDGRISIEENEFKNIFNESLEVIFFEKSNLAQTKRFGLSWFLPQIKKYRFSLIQVLIASFVVQLFGLSNPLLIQVIIDKVISQRSLDTLQILGVALIVVTFLGGIISSLRTFLFAETTNRIDTRLGAEVIDHLLRLPLNYFEKRPVGELGSRISEMEKIRNFLTGQALTTILDSAFSVIYIVVMVIYSWLLTIIALGVVPIQILITLIGSPVIRRQIREVAENNAKTQSHLIEVLTGVQTVKAQNVETVSRWKWQDLYVKFISKSFQKTITTTTLNQLSTVLQQISQLLVLWVGATLVLSGKLTLGQLIAFRIISGYVTQPLLRLSSIWQNIQELRVSFERLADIIDTNEESNEQDKANIPMPNVKGKVEFKNISFQFNKNSPYVLKNINLTIDPGTFVGVVGQSGSGKSTLMKLIPRLYEINKGKILIDNYDVDKVELYSLRRQIGIVPQDPLLFKGSVSENIALTNPQATSEEIVEVSKIAAAHEFIMSLPQGYSSEVGERGASLSGGQRQRIAIARTLLDNSKMLIMDEATSALDYDTEKKVCNGIKEKYNNLTVFFITHRLSTVKNANKIIMLNNGIIDEIGTHEELIAKRGRYYALYKQQESS
tara:strand:- start:8207 stop:11161 length:2955 start_codon:yes stop_codon:yes gene_type:complete